MVDLREERELLMGVVVDPLDDRRRVAEVGRTPPVLATKARVEQSGRAAKVGDRRRQLLANGTGERGVRDGDDDRVLGEGARGEGARGVRRERDEVGLGARRHHVSQRGERHEVRAARRVRVTRRRQDREPAVARSPGEVGMRPSKEGRLCMLDVAEPKRDDPPKSRARVRKDGVRGGAAVDLPRERQVDLRDRGQGSAETLREVHERTADPLLQTAPESVGTASAHLRNEGFRGRHRGRIGLRGRGRGLVARDDRKREQERSAKSHRADATTEDGIREARRATRSGRPRRRSRID